MTTLHGASFTAPAPAPPVAASGLAAALTASLALLHLPAGDAALRALAVLGTWMHEASHGLAMLATGAGWQLMAVFPDGSGLALAERPVGPVAQAVVAAAGYMGTPLWGAALLWLGRAPRTARRALAALAVLLALTTAAYVVGGFGQLALVACAAGLLAAAVLPGRAAIAACRFLAAHTFVVAVVDVRVLYRPLLAVDGRAHGSDAHQLAAHTLGTSAPWAVWTWATVWLAWALAIALVAWRWVVPRAGAAPRP